MLHSGYRPIARVAFPAFKGRQVYMHEIDLSDPDMGPLLGDYTPMVRSLCRSSGVSSGRAFVTVDEKIVAAGGSQRRPRPHVDGCFMPSAQRWGHPGPAWVHGAVIKRMPVIVAASVSGCRAWRGDIEATPESDGDLSTISGHIGAGEMLPANIGFLLSPDCIHESMTFATATQRSFLRIALPVN